MKITKGQRFKCLQDYKMYDGWVAFSKGKIYVSEKDRCIVNNRFNHDHIMDEETDFDDYFEEFTVDGKKSNKELLQMTIDEELLKFGNWLLKNKDNVDLCHEGWGGFLVRKPMKEILEMYKKETNGAVK